MTDRRWVCTLGTIAALVEAPSHQRALAAARGVFRRHRGYEVDQDDIAIRPAHASDVVTFDRARDGAPIADLATTPVVAEAQEALW